MNEFSPFTKVKFSTHFFLKQTVLKRICEFCVPALHFITNEQCSFKINSFQLKRKT
jgi:hypothetical protein